MFVVECDGYAVLHTGDFRDHGYRGKGLKPTIQKHIVPRKIDVLITEGTMLGRDDGRMISEAQLCEQATELMRKYKYVFFMCTTQDADRISSINHATDIVKGRRMLVDGYQYKVLEAFEEELGQGKYFRYQYNRKCYYRKHWDYVLDKDCKRGFTMLVRNNRNMRKSLDEMMPLLDKEQLHCLNLNSKKAPPQPLGFPIHLILNITQWDWMMELNTTVVDLGIMGRR